MGIRDWPAEERPRERLLSVGASSLSDAELLAIFLRTGVRGRSAVALARDLLQQFGGLRALLGADQAQFCAMPGLGNAKYAQLQAVMELARRHLGEGLAREHSFTGVAAVRDYLLAWLRDKPFEVFACLFLDSQHRLIADEELFRGSIDGASVPPREVVRRCLALNAAAVVLVHNHPSGVAEPSAADERLTERLGQALALVDVRVLDHFIVGDGVVTAFSERGLL